MFAFTGIHPFFLCGANLRNQLGSCVELLLTEYKNKCSSGNLLGGYRIVQGTHRLPCYGGDMYWGVMTFAYLSRMVF